MKCLIFLVLISFIEIYLCKDIRDKFLASASSDDGFQKHEEALLVPAEMKPEKEKRCAPGRLGSTLSSRLGYQRTDASEEKPKKGRKIYETFCKACIKKNRCESLNITDCPICEKWCIQAASICDNEKDVQIDPDQDDPSIVDFVSSRGNFKDDPNIYTVTMTNGTLMEIILQLLSIRDTSSVECVTITVKSASNQPIKVDSVSNDEGTNQIILDAINEKRLTHQDGFMSLREIEEMVNDILAKLHSKSGISNNEGVHDLIQKPTLRESESENVMHQTANPDVIEESPDMSSVLGTSESNQVESENAENPQMLNRNSEAEMNFLHQEQPRDQLFSDSLQKQIVGEPYPSPEDPESTPQRSAAFADNAKTVEWNPESRTRENFDQRAERVVSNIPISSNGENMRTPTHHHHHLHHHSFLTRSKNPANELKDKIVNQEMATIDKHVLPPPFFPDFFRRSNLPKNYEQIGKVTRQELPLEAVPELEKSFNNQQNPEISSDAREHHHHFHHHHWHSSHFRANDNSDESPEDGMTVLTEDNKQNSADSPRNSPTLETNPVIDESAVGSPTESNKIETPSDQQLFSPTELRTSNFEVPVAFIPEESLQNNEMEPNDFEGVKDPLTQGEFPVMESQNEPIVEEESSFQRKTKLGAKADQILKKIKDRQDQNFAKFAKVKENFVGQRKSLTEPIKKGSVGNYNNVKSQNLDPTENTLHSIQEPVRDTFETVQTALEKLNDLTSNSRDVLGSQPLDNSWERNVQSDSRHFMKPLPEPKSEGTMKLRQKEDPENDDMSIQGKEPTNEELFSTKDIQISYEGPSDIFFIGNSGIKLPLLATPRPDGSVSLSVDLEKLCACHNITCPKNPSTLERTVEKILENNAKRQENYQDDTVGMAAPNQNADFDFEITRNRRSADTNSKEVTLNSVDEDMSKEKAQGVFKDMLVKSIEDLKKKMFEKKSTPPGIEGTKIRGNVIPITKMYKFKNMKEELDNNNDKSEDTISKLDGVLLENESTNLRKTNDPLIRKEIDLLKNLLGFFKNLAVDNNKA